MGIGHRKGFAIAVGVVDFSPEYEDCRTIARENGLRLVDVINEVVECYSASLTPSSDTISDASINADVRLKTKQTLKLTWIRQRIGSKKIASAGTVHRGETAILDRILGKIGKS